MTPAFQTVGEVAAVDSGPAFKSAHFGGPDEGIRLLRGDNIEPGALRWTRTKTWPESMLPGYEHLAIQEGDLILGMDRPLISAGLKLARARPSDLPALLVQRVARIRPHSINGVYLYHWLSSFEFQQHLKGSATGTQLPHVNLKSIKEFKVPRFSEAAEARIVEVLEDHLSRLDAGVEYLDVSNRRARVLTKSVLISLIPDREDYPSRWESSTVGNAGSVGLGRQRHPDWHSGPNMRPYLRVANVFEDRIDTSSLMEMHWPEETFERFRLHPGDVLLNEGQSPEWLGRPAIYRGVPGDVAFTNSLLRFKAREDVLPEFALLVFRRHMHAGRFARESRITTNIAHLSATRLKKIEFPVPPLEEQLRMVEIADMKLTAVKQLEAEIAVAQHKASSLRRSLLDAAFSGRLTGAAAYGLEGVEAIAADVVEAEAPEGVLV
ncbi:restriction endonuclease subunit S [Streptomyces sp. NPDC051064]|uniref:restriction endonuclease subunit S n=1 Tax=Streptomyces sp. NPDC051064 TaxID=3365641 RepID=UPI0037B50270